MNDFKKIRGMMYDTGRDSGGSGEFFDKMLHRLADYGYNMLAFNLEYRYRFPSHPELACPDSLTPETVRQMDETARSLGIDLVPIMNCAGHCRGIGMTDLDRKFCASSGKGEEGLEQLRIDLPETVQFVRELYGDLYDSFRNGRYFHIGGDEIRHLDLLYPDLDPTERMKLAIGYLNGVIADVKAHGRIPMMWGDMLIKYPECLECLDRDVIICDWSYFSSPAFKGLSNLPTLTLFRDAGRPTLFADAVSSWIGNPVIAENSTMNIVYGTKEYEELFGDKAAGTMTTVWQDSNTLAYDAVWPWLWLQSRVCGGEERDHRSLAFLGEYTELEWGLPHGDGRLERWYRCMDTEFSRLVLYEAMLDKSLAPALERNTGRPYKLMRTFVNSLFGTRNPLPPLNHARSEWLSPSLIAKIRPLYTEALEIAEGLAAAASRRREEPEQLADYSRMMLAVLDAAELEGNLEDAYHAAAAVQFRDADEFRRLVAEMQGIFGRLADIADLFVSMLDGAIETQNLAADASMPARFAARDFRLRAEMIADAAERGVSFVMYRRFISRDADMPMVRHLGSDWSK